MIQTDPDHEQKVIDLTNKTVQATTKLDDIMNKEVELDQNLKQIDGKITEINTELTSQNKIVY